MSGGGARPDAERKRKSGAARELEYRTLLKPKAVKLKGAEIEVGECPEPHGFNGFMSMATKNASENIAPAIYKEIFAWLKRRGCDGLVQPQLVDQHALSYARYAQAETAIHRFGFLAKHATSGQPVPSPFIEIGESALKRCQSAWQAIYGVIRDVCGEYSERARGRCNGANFKRQMAAERLELRLQSQF
jgi:hypothetical protein